MGLVYYAFDLLEVNGQNRRSLPLRLRIQELVSQVSPNAHPYIVPAQTAGPQRRSRSCSARRERQARKDIEHIIAEEVDRALSEAQ